MRRLVACSRHVQELVPAKTHVSLDFDVGWLSDVRDGGRLTTWSAIHVKSPFRAYGMPLNIQV